MAKLPAFRRFSTGDVPEQHRPWMTDVLRPLNEFMNGVHTALSSGLTIRENLAEEIRTVTITDGPPEVLTTSFSAAHTSGIPTITPTVYYAAFIDIGVGFPISSSNLPAGTTVLSWDAAANTITCSQNATGTGTVTTTWTSPNPDTYPVRISLTMRNKPVGAHIVKVVKTTDRKRLIRAQPVLDWYYDDQNHQVVIKDIVGLTHGTKYEVTVRIVGE